jgi:predicted acetyltransferase
MHVAIPIISLALGVLNYIYWRKKGHSNWGILLFGTIVSFILLAMLSKYLMH